MGNGSRGVWSGARALACLLCIAAACAGLLAATGCGPASDAKSAALEAAESPRRGGTYNFPLVALPAAVVPWGSPEAGLQVHHQVFEGLTACLEESDGTFTIVPCLAEDWSANDDATVWTFRLRRGVTFQPPADREVTAADVVADCRYAVTAKNACWYAYQLSCVEGTDDEGVAADPRRLGVEALDRYTVRYTLKRPFADFPGALSSTAGWVWPVDYLRRVGRARFGQQPSGTGPFLVSRVVRGQYIDLARNPEWWDAASGRPYLDGVHFRVFPSVSAQLQAFQKGLIDYTWVPPGQLAASRSLPEVRSGEWMAVTVPILAIGYIAFRVTDPIMRGENGLLLRQAINFACDRTKMIATATDGVFRLPTGYVPSILPGWQKREFPQTHDIARAAALYEAVGSPPLTIVIPRDSLATTAAETLRADLASVGVPLTVETMPFEEYGSAVVGRKGVPIYTFGWVADYPSADNFLYDLFHSATSIVGSGTGYSDPEVDRLLEEARSTTDAALHLELNRRAAALITQDLPALPLFQFADYRLISSRIGGFHTDPMDYVNMWELWCR